MSARTKRKASVGGPGADDGEEFYSASPGPSESEDSDPSDGEDNDQRPGGKRPAKRPAKATPKASGAPAKVKTEPGTGGGSGGRGRGTQGVPDAPRGGGGAGRGRGRGGGGSRGGGGGSGAGGEVPNRIAIDVRERARMDVKIREYEQAAAEAETKLAQYLSSTEYEALAGRVVRLMLFKQHKAPGVPVKRTDITEACMADYKSHPHFKKLPALAIRLAQARIIAVLGLEMRELLRGARGADAAAGGTSTFVLHSVLPTEVRRALVDDPADDQAQAFKMVVLALIHLNGGHMESEELWRHLQQLGVERTDQQHPDFGRPDDALKHLIATRYLTSRQQAAMTGAVEVLEWAEHAHAEVGEERVQRWIEQEFANAPGFNTGGGGGGGGSEGS